MPTPDPLIVKVGGSTYALKWFNVDDKGNLIGSYRNEYTYRLDWQKVQYDNPVLCRSGYHVLHRGHMNPFGRALSELWLVAVRGNHDDRSDKSTWGNVRPIFRIATAEEFRKAMNAVLRIFHDLTPRVNWSADALHRRVSSDVNTAVHHHAQQTAPVYAVTQLWKEERGESGPGSYQRVRLEFQRATRLP
jgi:hypothetical protein